MEILRTPDDRFDSLEGYPFAPHYVEVDAGDGTSLRMHYVDEGEGELLLCLHGQPSWSYLYRKMIPILVEAGYRVVAPDLVGFGKSDKPADRADYTYANHVTWLGRFVEALDLREATLVCQDWGSLLGLRYVSEQPDRFARVVLSNGGLPDATGIPEDAAPAMRKMVAETPPLSAEEMNRKFVEPDGGRPGFMYWVRHCDAWPGFHPGEILSLMTKECDEEERRAWAAPFPSEDYLAGARQFPSLVPIIPDDPAIPANRAAWAFFESFDKPFMTAFGDSDPVTKGGEKRWIETVPGAKGQDHSLIQGAGHFIQDDAAEAFSRRIIDFVRANPAA